MLRRRGAGDDVGVEGEYWLRTYARVGHWARVSVVAEPAASPQVRVSADACRWLAESYGPGAVTDVPPVFRDAAESGAVLALAEVGPPLAVTVTTIRFAPADTSADDVKFAAAYAVWEAVGHAPVSPPYIDADGVHFPAALLLSSSRGLACGPLLAHSFMRRNSFLEIEGNGSTRLELRVPWIIVIAERELNLSPIEIVGLGSYDPVGEGRHAFTIS